MNDLKNIINNYNPNFIINCIALTGIVYCQKKPKLAYKINAEIPFRILKIIKKKNIKFIHFSTEAVFEGKILKKIYSERDKALPTSVYGKSKLLADNKIIKQKILLLLGYHCCLDNTKIKFIKTTEKLIKTKLYIFQQMYIQHQSILQIFVNLY